MLEFIRKNSQSIWIKGAFGVIILVFVFLGVGSFQATSGIVARVNGLDISEQEFIQVYSEQAEKLRQQFPDLNEEQLKEMGFANFVLESLVVRTLLQEESERTGIKVSPKELLELISTFPFTKDANGKFSKELYLNTLKNAGQTPKSFEENLALQMLEDKFREFFATFSYTSPALAKQMYDFQLAERAFNTYLIEIEPLLETVEVSEETLKEVYEKSKANYIIPASISLEMIEITPEKLSKPAEITDEEVENEYLANKARYDTPESVTASHILISLAENASKQDEAKALEKIAQIQAKLKENVSFADLAKEFSDDPGSAAGGGSLGTFTRGQMVKPFEEAAFALENGKVSEPVRSQFGYHLIFVENKIPAKELDQKAKREVIEVKLALEKAKAKLQSVADSLLLQIHGNTEPAEAAKKEGLELTNKVALTEADLKVSYSLSDADIQLLQALDLNEYSKSAIATSQGLIIAKVTDKVEQSTQSYEQVKEQLLSIAKQTAAHDEAKTLAENMLKDPSTIPSNKLAKAQINRAGSSSLGANTDLADAIFDVKPNSDWLQTPYFLDNAYALIKPLEEIPASPTNWELQKEMMTAQIEASRSNVLLSIYLEELRRTAEVKIINQAYFQ